MDVIIRPGMLAGAVRAVSSKSMTHRLLILAAMCDGGCEVVYDTNSQDIEATRRCLEAMVPPRQVPKGMTLDRKAQDTPTKPISASRVRGGRDDATRTLPCAESGSTLRFLLPVVGALGLDAAFVREGRLAQRPLAPFDAELEAHGLRLVSQGDTLRVSGRLTGGRFVLPGNVSSQYVSGLLLAAPLLAEPLEVLVGTPVQSMPYIDLTIHALKRFGVGVVCDSVRHNGTLHACFAPQRSPLVPPGRIEVEGDWSNAAFWLAAGALEYEGVTVYGLDLASPQGDRAVLAALAAFGARIARKGDAARATRLAPHAATINVSAIPDLVPPLAAVAATAEGQTRLTDAGRLRLKESDRLATVSATVRALGGNARIEGDDLVIVGVPRLTGGLVDAANDHRIAMMAAVMATHATGPVRIAGAQCVAKSYPGFWDDYRALGGRVDPGV